MNQELVNFPAARNWRDIPQPVKPRAMSRGGRWRLLMAGGRTAGIGVLIAAAGWGAWLMVAALHENSRAMPAAAKNVPIRTAELVTAKGGVLDSEWLARALALPKNISLMELDLDRLQARLLNDGQVLTATLTRNFPDRLTVKIAERTPAARVKVQLGSEPQELLVARDGVVFVGHGFERQLLDSLPWLSGMTLGRDGAWFRPVPGMNIVSDLLARAQEAAPHLYQTWHIVSIERLALDGEIDVITKSGSTIVFDARSSTIKQLAWLDYIVEKLERAPGVRARIDLSLGREVPVMIEPQSLTPDAAPGFTVQAWRPGPAAATPGLLHLPQTKPTREL